MKKNRGSRALRLGLIPVLMIGILMIGGCAAADEEPTQTVGTEPIVTETVPVVYDPAIRADADASSLVCKDSYLSEDAADVAVASVGEDGLTNRMLRFFYNMEIGAWKSSGGEPQPDYSKPLFSQLCPLGENLSWEHYFLDRALETWHNCQALISQSRQKQIITEKNYKAEPTTHEQFFPDTLPAYPLTYIDKECFTPNEMHQAFLDRIPEEAAQLAARCGFGNAQELAAALSGSGARKEELEEFLYLYNFAYTYFTELSYYLVPSEADVDAFLAEHPEDYLDSEKTVTILHSLMIPVDAETDDSGKVTASEEAWEACKAEIDALLLARKKDWVTNHNAENTFSVLANQNSADGGTRANGGRFVSVRKGQLHKQLEEWAFAGERKYGDVEVLRTDMGYEVLFFRSSETLGRAQAREEAQLQMLREKLAALKELYPMEVDFSKICLTEREPTAAYTDVLYPDIAHERFPELMVFLQQDYAPAPFGKWQVSRHGCGITTMAMVSTYLSDTLHTPAVLAKEYSQFANPNGTDGNIFDRISPELGFFCEKKCWDWTSVEEALNDGKIVVSLQWHGHFTKTGHYLALIRMTEDGKVVIRDSNIYNYARLAGHKVDCFDPQLVINNNSLYWIFEPKIRTIAACSRCGDPENCGMPKGLLREDYTCEKCRTALSRRNAFLELNPQ